MNIGTGLSLEQTLNLSMNQIQSLEILAMDTMELKNLLREEYLENPMFDCKDGSEEKMTLPMMRNSKDEFSDKDSYIGNLPMPDEEEIRKYLLSQLPLLGKEEEFIAKYLIDCLDENGFLKISIEEIAKSSAKKVADISKILLLLQELEPCGVFQADVRACLMKQLTAEARKDSLAYHILDEFWDEFLNGKISKITRAINVPTNTVRVATEEISRLNPYPFQGLKTGKSYYIEPDIIAEKGNGQWTVRLNDEWMENYEINDYYLSMMKKSADQELRNYFQKKLERARLLLNNVLQRRKTIEKVTLQVIEYQSEYFEGKGEIRPLTMAMMADEMGISTSTISRAVRGKYLQTPRGTILFKSLFSVSVNKKQSTDMSAEMLRSKIKEMISAEDKRHPLSDRAIAEDLERNGIQISRRAIAKYRDEMGIRSSMVRKIL